MTAPRSVIASMGQFVIMSMASVTVYRDLKETRLVEIFTSTLICLFLDYSLVHNSSADSRVEVLFMMHTLSINCSVKSSVRMVAMVRDANNCVDVRMEPAVTRWMEAADVLQDGEVHCVTRGHAPDLSCMDQTVH